NGDFLKLSDLYNVSSDISCTAGQVARAIGHAFASKVFRSFDENDVDPSLSVNGNEVCFFTIGEGSTSEGPFWEMMNAAGVLNIPLVAVVWDDGYSISVPVELQTTKSSISKALEGLLIDESGEGIHIYVAKAWDYQELCVVFQKAADIALGHSTSGSHERYKSKERLAWEAEFDCIAKMEEWLVSNALLSIEHIDQIKSDTKEYVKNEVKKAWRNYNDPIKFVFDEIRLLFSEIQSKYPSFADLEEEISHYNKLINPHLSEIHSATKRVKFLLLKIGAVHEELNDFISKTDIRADLKYHTHLYSQTPKAALQVAAVFPKYEDSSVEET
ncbi:MAG TPA: thiamine pyrophosphate-dependent enzyme, partial [Saprospiraceae bacterium]|nr:thiamine pyrophosphate-dependent enzyme [Saprospiraceae bacterium]